MEEVYSFIWEPYSTPYMVTPTQNRVELIVEHYVPYATASSVACPFQYGSSTDTFPQSTFETAVPDAARVLALADRPCNPR